MKPRPMSLLASASVVVLLAGCTTPPEGARAATRPWAATPIVVPLEGLETAAASRVSKLLAGLDGVASVEILEAEQAVRIRLQQGSSLSVAGLEKALGGAEASVDAERMLLGPRFLLKLTGVRCPDC